jgi:hypothetical protein
MPENYELIGFDSHDAHVWSKSYPTPVTDLIVERPCYIIALGIAVLAAITGIVFSYGMFAVSPASDRMYLIFSDPFTFDYDRFQIA